MKLLQTDTVESNKFRLILVVKLNKAEDDKLTML